MPGSTDKNLADKMRGIEINPMVIVAVLVVIVLGIGYFAWLRPKMAEDQALRDFNTPEAQAKRDPDKRAFSADTQTLINQLKAKEQHSTTGNSHRGQ
jgi:uncharacterized protein HemX